MASTAISRRLGRRIFASPHLREAATIYRYQPSPYPDGRDDHGNFVPGGFIDYAVTLISAPLSGQERLILPEALRSVETRNFYLNTPIEVLGDVLQGDVILYDDKLYRAEILNEWGGFRHVVGTYPTDADIDVTARMIDFDPADFAPEDWG